MTSVHPGKQRAGSRVVLFVVCSAAIVGSRLGPDYRGHTGCEWIVNVRYVGEKVPGQAENRAGQLSLRSVAEVHTARTGNNNPVILSLRTVSPSGGTINVAIKFAHAL